MLGSEARTGGTVVQSLPSILHALKRTGRVEPSMLGGLPLPHAGFVRAMAKCVSEERLSVGAHDCLKEYLSGEAVSAKTFASYGIKGIKNSLSRRNSESVLRTVIGGLHRLGVPGILL